ncbi:MAG: AfsR/SARP family transcriptional regulator [Candidatus Promineifilaceae bacterium]
MAELNLYLLGSPRVELDGAAIEVRPRKALALLIYLAVTAEPHTRDFLATLLWPESDQRLARRALSNRLSELRQALGEGWIDAGHETITLRPGCRLDTADFQRLSAGEHASPESLLEAVTLYRDDFLSGFTLPDCPEYDEWHYFQSESLRQDLAAALERLVETLSDRGDYETAVPHARRRLALDPLHEPACRRLMRLYAQSGRQSAALRQYDLCRQALAEELGVEPQEETTALYHEIQTESFVRLARQRHNLPAQTTSFIGREAELAEIARLLRDEVGCRLLNLAGPGGIGKTRLALAAAADVLDAFPDGAFFVSLAPISEVDDIVPTIAESLRFTFYGSAEPRDQLLDFLSRKQMLLVIDNFEHLQGGAGLLSELLAHAPGVTLLATSRERLNLQEEWVYEVRGLPFPSNGSQTSEVFELASDSKSPVKTSEVFEPVANTNSISETSEVLSSYSAVELFTQRARQVTANFSPTAVDINDIIQICRLVEGMPLGLELAAPWIKVLSPREIAAEIERSLDFLSTPLQNVPDRHRSLRVIFEQTWQRLSPQEQDVLQKLSIFRGGCTREAAQKVTGATLPVLSSLVGSALLRRTNSGRYEIHELLRQYAEEFLDEGQVAASAVRRRHLAYFTSFLAEREADLKGGRQAQALAELRADSDNIRNAWDYAILTQDLAGIDRASEGLGQFYDWDGRFSAGEDAFRRAVELLADRENQISFPADKMALILVKTLAWQAAFLQSLGDLSRASEILYRCEALLSEAGQSGVDLRPARAFVLLKLGKITNDHGDYEQAWRMFQESRELFSANVDKWGEANVLILQGSWLWGMGLFAEAKSNFEHSLRICRETNNLRETATNLYWLGLIATYQGEVDEAEKLNNESLAIYQDLSYPFGVAESLLNLGLALCFAGRFIDSKQILERSKLLYGEISAERGFRAEQIYELVQLHLGNYYRATKLHYSDSHYQDEGVERGIALGLLISGAAALAQKRYDRAQYFLRESIDRLRGIDRKDDLGIALSVLGIAAIKLDNQAQAAAHFLEALQISVDFKAHMPVIHTLPGVALLLASLGRVEQALELHALMQTVPYFAESRWFEDVIARPIESVAMSLTPEEIETARARGETFVIKDAAGAWFTWLPDLL